MALRANGVRVRKYLELVRFSHTLFALPFALAAAFVALDGVPKVLDLGLIVLCMATARNAAMAFNRLVDYNYDLKNPRTAGRPLVQGVVSVRSVRIFIVINSVLFVLAAWFLNSLAGVLALPILFILLFYSYTKRITWWCHVYLGLAIGLSPVGAWVALQGSFHGFALWLGLGLALWIAGFDMIYALQDEAFDKAEGLNSWITRFGADSGKLMAKFLHGLMWLVLVWLGVRYSMPLSWNVVLGVTLGLLVYIHWLRKTDSLDELNSGFFKANVAISFMVLMGVIFSLMLEGWSLV